MDTATQAQVSVRKIREKDLPFIPKLNKELGYDFDMDQVLVNLKEIYKTGRDVIFVAVNDNDNAIGYLHLSPYILIYYQRAVNILGLVVSESYRNFGVGKMLLNEAEQWARINNFGVIRLVSSDYRHDAHRFYLKNGYIHHKTQINFKKELV